MPSEVRSTLGLGDERERRLHPASLLFRVLGHARGLLIPAAAVFFFSRGESWQIFAAIAFLPIVALDVFRYMTLRWRYDADELVVRQGWIFRSERHVPYARIQNVDLKQNVLHRALSVAEVRIETAGGAEAEVSLSVVSLAAYEELRERAFAGRAAARAAGAIGPRGDDATFVGEQAARAETTGRRLGDEAPVETLLSLSVLDVFLLGLNPGRGLAILAIGWGLANEAGLLDGFEQRIDEAATLGTGPDFVASAATVLLVLAGFAALLVLSLAASVIEFANFRLEAQGDVFRVHRGLLTREVQSIPRGRIQVATVERPWFLGLLGRARVHVRTAGGIDGSDGGRRGRGRHFAPIVRSERVAELLTRIRAGLGEAQPDWRPLGRTAPRRFLISALIPAVALSAIAIALLEWIGAGVAFVLITLAVVGAVRRARRAAWARAPWGVAVREGAFSTAEHATFVDKIQSVELVENPFDRRHRQVTVRVDTAGALARNSADVSIRYLPREAAEELREELVGAAANARFRW